MGATGGGRPGMGGYYQPRRLQNLCQNMRSVDDYTTEFHQLVARNDVAETDEQLVTRHVGGLREQFQFTLNMFDLYSVSEAHQRALQLEKQANRWPPSTPWGVVARPTANTIPVKPAGILPPTVPPAIRAGGSSSKCYKCGEPGHRAFECRKSDRAGKALFVDAEGVVTDHSEPYEQEAAYDDDHQLTLHEEAVEEFVRDVGPLLVGKEPIFCHKPSLRRRRRRKAKWVTDALSRRASFLTLMRSRVIGFDAFRELLAADPYFSVILEGLARGGCPKFHEQGGFLFKGNALCVPESSLRLKITKELHDEGHIVNGFNPRAPVDLLPVPDRKHAFGKAEEFMSSLQQIHRDTEQRLHSITAKYKEAADKKRRNVEFEVGDFVYAVLTKDRFPEGEFNKLKARKIGPIEILEKINPNAYRLKLPSHVRTADAFNVKLLIPFRGDSSNASFAIKLINLDKLGLPNFDDVGKEDFVNCGEYLLKPRKALSDIQNLATGISDKTPVKHEQIYGRSQYSQPLNSHQPENFLLMSLLMTIRSP
ncbi:hypothetical protein RHSIM_Rhsim08G0120100 [Rhododendron simsii]|uniref:CCHC-type domain-containing protein n=1 Tax=Rhododendron simsii TaxID=118357 RepID=A0A834GJZ2_RHOSS|nr:hypothetical protein RHSIM_Rhsim08G0120100 [Rhododendron simsii]